MNKDDFKVFELARSTTINIFKSLLNQIRSQVIYLEPTEKYENNKANVVKKENVTHTYKDGSYNQKIKDNFDGSFVVKYMRSKDYHRVENVSSSNTTNLREGVFEETIGLKVYKNKKEVFANADYAASKIGLKKITHSPLKDFIRNPFFICTKGSDDFNDFYINGNYIDDNRNIYSWNSKTKEFEQVYPSIGPVLVL